MSWEETFQNWGTLLVDRASSAKYVQPYEVDKLRLQALGDMGYYTEGQRGTVAQPGGLNLNGGTLLLLGLGLAAVMMLKD